jgi:hypothetical protein
MYMFCRIMSAKKFRNLNFKACGFQENMISYRQRVNMDPGGKGAPLARRTPKECVFAQPCHVFLHAFIRNTTAVSCKAGGGGASGMLSFPKPVPPLAHGAARSGEHRGRKTQKKELDFLHRLWYYTGAVARLQQITREWWNWQTR